MGPSTSYEWLARFTYQPKRSLTASLQIREKQKARNISTTETTQLFYQLAPLNKFNVKFEVSSDQKFIF
jgi:hypothetical protein